LLAADPLPERSQSSQCKPAFRLTIHPFPSPHVGDFRRPDSSGNLEGSDRRAGGDGYEEEDDEADPGDRYHHVSGYWVTRVADRTLSPAPRFSATEWLAHHIPGAELRISPGDGHISVLREAATAVAWLSEQASRL
jgi:hypothetical protein